MFASIRGSAFEAHVHRNYKTLSTCQITPLTQTVVNSAITTINGIPELGDQEGFTNASELATRPPHSYCIPKQLNFASVDAIIPPNIALQMTVSADHGFKVDGLKAVKEALKLDAFEPLHVILVCPDDIKFGLQKLRRGTTVVQNPTGLKDGEGLIQYSLHFKWP
jgi:hypothetical protein